MDFTPVELKVSMLVRFGSSETKRPIAQLKKLREDESLFGYVDAFVSWVSQVNLSDEDRVAIFVEGLKQENKRFITVMNPKNLQ